MVRNFFSLFSPPSRRFLFPVVGFDQKIYFIFISAWGKEVGGERERSGERFGVKNTVEAIFDSNERRYHFSVSRYFPDSHTPTPESGVKMGQTKEEKRERRM